MVRMMRMNTKTRSEVFYPKLSYLIVGMCFDAHNSLGVFAKEKQYGDFLEHKLKDLKIDYKRECFLGDSKNIVDFIIDNKILLEIKAKRLVTKEDYYQTQRYLQESKIRLGILVNFRDKYIKPIRVVRIDTSNKNKFYK